MAQNPSHILPVALCAAPGDAGFDLAAPGAARAVAVYERTRDLRDLGAVPTKGPLTLFVVAPLTSAQRALVEGFQGESARRYHALRFALRRILLGAQVSPEGIATHTEARECVPPQGSEQITAEDMDRVQEEWGADAIDELGEVVRLRARLPLDRDRARQRAAYVLPWPLTTAR